MLNYLWMQASWCWSLKECAKRVTEKSVSTAASKLRGATDTVDVGVHVDRTWQRKGFTSLNGVITATSIDSGKVFDIAILFKSCNDCSKMQAIKTIDLQDYGKWSAAHKCGFNCKGSYEKIYRHVNKFSLKVRFFI